MFSAPFGQCHARDLAQRKGAGEDAEGEDEDQDVLGHGFHPTPGPITRTSGIPAYLPCAGCMVRGAAEPPRPGLGPVFPVCSCSPSVPRVGMTLPVDPSVRRGSMVPTRTGGNG